MAMNYAWQERKKFMIPVIAGVAVVGIWYLFVLSSINAAAEKDASNRKSAEGMLRLRMQSGVPTDEGVGRAERDKGQFQKDLKDIQDKLVFKVDESFKVKEGQSFATKFGSQRQAVFGKIDPAMKQRAVDTKDSKFALLKFPSAVSDLPEPVVAEWLTRMAIVQRVCLFSIEAGVSSLDLLEVVPDDRQEEPTLKGDSFLGMLNVKFKVTGTADTIIKVIHGLQQEGPNYLSVGAVEIISSDPTKNLLQAVLSAGALVVKPDGALAAPEGK